MDDDELEGMMGEEEEDEEADEDDSGMQNVVITKVTTGIILPHSYVAFAVHQSVAVQLLVHIKSICYIWYIVQLVL